ncbi:HutD family protein [Rhodobacter sp. Har01]|uniref:HutD/Ves family protein n=1 Tax=Rhodobacter sp. Har01 TaxID=2883999 RepID=UPI001D098028|nr:HutD family protein [Rhodobacter sp. Har01]MCB6179472.1 HutD family protein [Rhodobacter sp. Har01]
MRHLTPADYRVQPWKNGRGTTVEMFRAERDGILLARLSRATVTEDGPFSLFPGLRRNLTVLTGRGFRLVGPGVDLDCAPLEPVAFPGDVAVAATGTGGHDSEDFNVMTAAHLPAPEVAIARDGSILAAGGLLALYALAPVSVNGTDLGADDLLLTTGPARIHGRAPVVATRLFGL